MKSAAALATVFAVGALSVPNAHNHHEHLHRRHAEAEPQAVDYVTAVATNTVVQYVNGNGQPVNGPASSSTPAPAPPAGQGQQNKQGGSGHFSTVVTADNGQPVTADAWQWGSPNGQHGYSWTYQQPAGGQQTAAPAASSQAPASQAPPQQYSAPASQAAPAKSSAAPSSAAASSAAAPSSSGSSGSNQWQQSIVQAHNAHRQNHSVPDIQWHDGLASAAQMVANKCSFTHDLSTGKDQCGFSSYGQNFACVGGDASEDPTKDISGQWYGEEGLYETSGSYGLANPNPAYTIVNGQKSEAETGHFTQVVWKASTHVGCALANCPNGVSGTSGMDSLFVCDYGPEGNMGGEYADNVPRPNGAPSSSGTSYS